MREKGREEKRKMLSTTIVRITLTTFMSFHSLSRQMWSLREKGLELLCNESSERKE
jgi:hypothetical protein